MDMLKGVRVAKDDRLTILANPISIGSETLLVVKILAGGLAFADSGNLAVEMGADAYAADPDEAIRLGGQLVGLPTFLGAE